jgi:acyl phosphate:glycerol-3-phosphate acyltransferase
MDILINIVMILVAFISGSLPFSVWLGKLVLSGKDVRQIGDGNPGATNVFRAGGKLVGIIVLLLDILKGAIPVAIAYRILGMSGLAMWCVALAPSLGHAFSPFLKGKGGKALAVTLGTWIGLTWYGVSLPIMLTLTFWYLIFAVDGWVVVFTASSVFLGLLVFIPQPLYLAVMLAQLLLLSWTHRTDLRNRITFRGWITRRFKKDIKS